MNIKKYILYFIIVIEFILVIYGNNFSESMISCCTKGQYGVFNPL